jgi:hypothetical protein
MRPGRTAVRPNPSLNPSAPPRQAGLAAQPPWFIIGRTAPPTSLLGQVRSNARPHTPRYRTVLNP